MLLSPTGRKLSLIGGSLFLPASGFAGGVWWGTATPATVPPVDGITTYESTRILPPAPKNRVNVDGIVAESDQPISIEMEWIGDGRVFDGSGRAVSPGITTDNAEIAGKMGFNSGTPAVPTPPGSAPLNVATAASGVFDIITKIRGGNWIALILGTLVLAGTGYAVYCLFWVSRKQAITAAGVGVPLGALLVLAGIDTERAAYLLMAALGVALVGAGAFVVLAMRAKSMQKELDTIDTLAGKVAVAVDESDDGQFDTAGNPLPTNAGGRIKRMVKSLFKGDSELEAAFDELKSRYNA